MTASPSSSTRVAIYGTGACAPERVISNEWFKQYVDTSDEWIVQRTGIHERRFARDDQSCSDLAHEAAQQALDDAGWKAEELDFIVLGTCTPDTMLPNTAQYVHHLLGARPDCGAIDVINACSSFTYAISLVAPMIRTGQVRKVLAIGAEKLSPFLNFEDRTSCILFGDGAGAACLAAAEEGTSSDILNSRFGTHFDYESLNLKAGGSRMPASHETIDNKDHFVRTNGRAVFKFAVNTLRDEIVGQCEAAGISPGDIQCVIPHQANIRIIQAAMEAAGFPIERTYMNLQRFGNTSAASVPLALAEAAREGAFQRGDLIVLCAFGAGLAWGSQLIRW